MQVWKLRVAKGDMDIVPNFTLEKKAEIEIAAYST
jgi:hypothetical protein